jgi:hypothetical protein
MVAMPSRFAVSMARTMLLEFPLVEIAIATSSARPTSVAKYDQFVARVQPFGQRAHFCDLVYLSLRSSCFVATLSSISRQTTFRMLSLCQRFGMEMFFITLLMVTEI